MSIIKEFSNKAGMASFHYADDSGKEWGLARECVKRCRELLEQHPEHRQDFLEIASTQLCADEITKGYTTTTT